MKNSITFGTLQPNGEVTNVRQLKQSKVASCPHFIFDPSHYTTNGCRCTDKTAKEMRQWGYKWSVSKQQWI